MKKRSKLRWLKKRYDVTNEFFVVVKQCNPHLLVTKLENEMGEVVSSQIGFRACCKKIYSNFHIKGACGTNSIEVLNVFFEDPKGQDS
jgi:hypothetical protein